MRDRFTSCYPLKSGRAHEVTGQGASVFAAVACRVGTMGGARPALWLVEGWRTDQINPRGLVDFCDPERLLMVRVPDQKTMLACAEEALRCGAVSVVVAELPRALSFTAGRRLQLAAEEGQATGILMIGEDMGNNAAESRWHCAPLFNPEVAVHSGGNGAGEGQPDSTLQRWHLIKNKSGTLGYWDIVWDAETRRIIVVSEAGERPHSAATASDDAICAHIAAE